MDAKRIQPVVKLLPSFTDFAFLAPLVFLFGRMEGAKTLLGDGDTGWHIRTGEWIAANRAVPTVDLFSFSRPGEPWFAWEWLSDVVFAWLNAVGGLRAVTFFSALLLAATYALLFRLVRRRSNPIIAIAVTVFAAVASSIHWLARPHIFTLLLMVVFCSLLERVRSGEVRVGGIPCLAILPVLTVLWTNLHGGFIAGIVVIGAYAAGELLQCLLSPETLRAGALERAGKYAAAAGACLAASLINPYTYHLHVHMVKYLRDPWNGQHIVEFFSPSFHHATAIFFEVLLILGVAAAVAEIAGRRFIQPVLILVWTHGALLAARNIPIFAIVAAPAVAAAMEHWMSKAPQADVAGWLRRAAERFNRIAGETAETERISRWHLVSVIGVALLAAVLWAPNPPGKFRAEFDPKIYPSAALAAVNKDGSRIFTTDEWGDYLIWRLYPSLRVFVDGRSDFYGNAFEEKYVGVLRVTHGWDETLQQFGVDTILMPPDAPLTGALKESPRWSVVYDDGVAVVFRPTLQSGGETSSAAGGRGTGRDREAAKPETGHRSQIGAEDRS